MDTNTFTHSLNFTLTYWGGEGHDPQRVYRRADQSLRDQQRQLDSDATQSASEGSEETTHQSILSPLASS